MNKLDILKTRLSTQARVITSWLEACNVASDDNTHPLLSRAIYSAMDNVEAVQEEQGISATEAFAHFQGSVQSCIDDAEGMYGKDFVKSCAQTN